MIRFYVLNDLKQRLSDDIYFYHVDKLDKNITRLHGKWNGLSRRAYEIEQHLHSECIENFCKEKSCAYYDSAQRYKKIMSKSAKIKKQIEKLERKKALVKSQYIKGKTK